MADQQPVLSKILHGIIVALLPVLTLPTGIHASGIHPGKQLADGWAWGPVFILGLVLGLSIGYIVFRVLIKERRQEERMGKTITLSHKEPQKSKGPGKEPFPQKSQADQETCVVDEQLIQSHKLAAFGQLSTGVAHEINNPLAIINEEAGWLQDLLRQYEVKDFKRLEEFQESLGIIVQQTRRCANITHKLLSFAQNMESNVRDLDLNEIIDEVVCMMEKEAFYNGITIERAYDKSLPTLCSDPAHLRQMFVNLLKNAFDAVEKNGRVTIGTRKAGGNTVSITVADSGCGISKEHIDKVFDPFFTTKPPGKGTGLGLSICYGIATILGGSISVESIVNQGATFTITLPLKPPENIKVRTGDLD